MNSSFAIIGASILWRRSKPCWDSGPSTSPRSIRRYETGGSFQATKPKPTPIYWGLLKQPDKHESSSFFTNHGSRVTNHSPTEVPMGRGAQAQTQQMIDQQLSQQNAMNQQLYSSSQGLGSQAAAGYENLVANPGYTDAEKSAIPNLSQAALSPSFHPLRQKAATRAARTRNSAG